MSSPSSALPFLSLALDSRHIINAERYLSGELKLVLSILLHDANSGLQLLRYRSSYMIIGSRLETKYGTSGDGLSRASRYSTSSCGTVQVSCSLSTSKVRPYSRMIVQNSTSSIYRIALSGLATHLSHNVRLQLVLMVKPSPDCP